MTATSPTSPQIDASCRLPLFALFGGAAFWLALSSVFGLLASLKFHAPAMLANCACLSYGRAYPAWSNLLVYGFCIPAGLGVGLWLTARLGRVELAQPWLIVVGAKFWHIGVLVGLIGILVGDSSGFEWLEMPRYAAVILFLAFMLITMRIFVAYARRNEETLHPSQWFVLASLFWFPWIFSTATLLLQMFPVRGVVQASIAWWFSGNLLNVWLTLVGLASAFYILPKLVERPLQSQYLALFTFWTLILFGTWTGIPAHAALPAWMPTLSGMAGLLTIVPALAALVILLQTTRVKTTIPAGGPLCFTTFGVWSLVLASTLLALTACPQINRVTDFTWFGHGQNLIRLYGFFAMTIFGAVYYILPLIAGEQRVCKNRVRAHFWLNAIGVLLFALPLLIAGVLEGFKWLNPNVPPVDVAKSTLMAFRISTFGELLIAVGNALFFFNILAVIVGYYFSITKAAYMDATSKFEPAGVKP